MPQSAIDMAIAFADLDANDVLIHMTSKSIPVGSSSDSAVSPCDLPQNGEHHHCDRYVGIEISPGHAKQSCTTNQETVLNHTTDSRDHPATCEHIQQYNNNQRSRRVVTYMNPIENKVVVKKELCKVGNVEGAAFPIYLYHRG
ncbi:hypothetical protein HJC23_013931 [Cyclotella cryptica]|uniref:Uncharacterized protein n=1 Tax=Cyclotella cryptica TaxID=29204 RepID=A0ABD3QIZ6_9STRA|eukprot:CCRYP_005539-RA/>CCRYP_005539-RA protein AED:0.19 eAED:0.24 QI:49/0/0/1/0/0/4/0/142